MNDIVTPEKLKAMIWQRYGNFELSHEKNVGIVENIFDFIIDQRIEFATFHVQAALKAASENAEIDSINLGSSEFQDVVSKNSILNAYPLTNIT